MLQLVEPGRASPYGWQAFRAKARQSPGYRDGDDPSLYEAWQAEQASARNDLGAISQDLRAVWGKMQQGSNGGVMDVAMAFADDLLAGDPLTHPRASTEIDSKDAAATAAALYQRLTPEQRPLFMDGLGLLARTFPDQEQATFFGNLKKQGTRDVNALFDQINSVPRSGDDIIGSGDFGLGPDTTTKLRTDWQPKRQQLLDARNFAADVQRIAEQDYSPVKSAWGDGGQPGMLESAAYALPGLGATVGMASVPYAGQLALYSSIQGSTYDGLRSQLRQAGLSDPQASAYADDWSGPLAAPLTALGLVQAGPLVKRLPILEKLIPAIGDAFESGVARFAARTAISSVEQTGVMLGQELAPYAMQELQAAFSKEIPHVKWSNDEDGPLDGLWTKAGRAFVTTLPLALITGLHGISRDAKSRSVAEMPALERQAFGLSPEASAAIDAGAQRGQSSLNAAVERGLATRDPNSATAKTAVAEIEARDAAKAKTEAATDGTARYPTFHRGENGLEVRDGSTGEVVGTATNWREALRMAELHYGESRRPELAGRGSERLASELQPVRSRLITTEDGIVALRPDTGQPLGPPGTREESLAKAQEAAEERATSARGGELESGTMLEKTGSSLADSIPRGGRGRTPLDRIAEIREKGASLLAGTLEKLGINRVKLSEEAAQAPGASSLSNDPAAFENRIASLVNQLADPSKDRATVLENHNREIVDFLHRKGGVPLATMEGWIRETERATSKRFFPDGYEKLSSGKRLEVLGNAWHEITARSLSPEGKGAISADQMPHGFRNLIRQNAMVTELAGEIDSGELTSQAVRRKMDIDNQEGEWKAQAAKLQRQFTRQLTGTKRIQYAQNEIRFFDLTKEERQIGSLNAEVLILYSRGDGSFFSSKSGELSEVIIPHLKDLPSGGMVIIHNHPSGAGPSISDIANILDYAGSIFRIIAKQEDGSYDVYQIRATPEKLFPEWEGSQNEAWKDLKEQLKSIHSRAATGKTIDGSHKALAALKRAAGGAMEIETRNLK